MAAERSERRAHPRVHLVARVEVEAEGRSFLAVVRNVGAGGLLIFTGNPAAHEARLHVTFVLPDSEKIIDTRAVVRHVAPQSGMGVQFEALSAEDADAIRAFVAHSLRSESPA
jgi:hypothetical protein